MTYADVEKKRHHRGCWCPELKGTTAIVTGAGGFRSLGRSIALDLARQGVNIVLTDLERDAATLPQEERDIGWQGIHSVAKDIEAAGAGALPLFSDVSDAASVDHVVAAAMARFGGIDFLVNNAGAPVGKDRGPVVGIPPDAWMRVVNVNLNGTFLMSRAVAQSMIARGQGGAIVNISSAASR
jgi:NAD(P)-dependent dehydrogenase (short-subunit alcohol dehydrogenase family)